MTVFAAFIVTLPKAMSAPVASVPSLNVISASTLASVTSVASVLSTGSLNVIVGTVLIGTLVALFTGKNVAEGPRMSSTVKMAEARSTALSASSSTT